MPSREQMDKRGLENEWMDGHEGLYISNRDYKPYSMDQYFFLFLYRLYFLQCTYSEVSATFDF